MIIAVSIVDKHKITGAPASGHVGTYYLEVDYPAGHEGQIALMALVLHEEDEAAARKLCGRLLSLEDIIRETGQAVTGTGEVLN